MTGPKPYTAIPFLPTRTDATRAGAPTSSSTQPFSSNPLLEGFVRDPFGNIVAALTQPVKDLGEIFFSFTQEELDDPAFQARMRGRGLHPESLRANTTANDRLRAHGNTAVNLISLASGLAVTKPAMALAMRAGLNGVSRSAAIGAADAMTGGAVAGMLMTPPEGMSRLEQSATLAALAIPFGVLGGAASHGLANMVRAKGVIPEFDAPEVLPQGPAGYMDKVTPSDKIAQVLVRVDEALSDAPPVQSFPPSQNLPPAPGRTPASPAPPTQPVVAPPPAPLDDMGKVLGGMSIGETSRPSLSVGGFMRWMYDKAVDDLAPLNRATQSILRTQGRTNLTPGTRLPGIDDPYVLARLAKGAPDVAFRILEHGPQDWVTQKPTGTPGIRQIAEAAGKLPPVGTRPPLDELRALLASRRAVELNSRGLPPGPIDVVSAERVVASARPEIAVLADQTTQFQTEVLTYLRDSGALSDAGYQAIRQLNQDYVPFYRFIEDEPTGPSAKGGKSVNNQVPIRAIKGGAADLRIVDPMESIVKNTLVLTQVAHDAAAGQALVRLANDAPGQTVVTKIPPPMRGTGVPAEEVARSLARQGEVELAEQIRALPPEVQDEIATVFRPKEMQERGVFYVQGKTGKEYFQTDPALWDALMGNREHIPLIIKTFMVHPANILRQGVTADPAFALRNAPRDAFNNAVMSRYGLLPGVDFVRGVFETVGRPDLVDAFKRSGAGFATFTRMTERANVQRALARSLAAPDSHYRSAARAVWDGLREFTAKGEEAMRLREFANGSVATGDPRLAAFAARDLLDFNRAGSALRVANQIVPFLNPQIQGLDKIARVAMENPTAFVAKNLAYISGPALALYAMNRGNPDYKALPEWRKDLMWNIPIPGGSRIKFISFPVPFELGLVFKSGVERMARWIDEKDPAAFDGYAENLGQSFLPPVVPTVASGAITAWSNRNLMSGRPIIPRREEDLLPAAQVRADQGEVTRWLAGVFNASPRMLEAVVRAHTGGLGANLLKSLDVAEQALGELRGRAPVSERGGVRSVPFIGPIARGFLLEEPTLESAPVEKFYDHYSALGEFANTLEVYGKDGSPTEVQGMVKEYGPDIAWYKTFQRAAQQMAQGRKDINGIRAAQGMSREEREQKILIAGRIIRQIAESMNKQYDQFNRTRAKENDPTQHLNRVGTTYEPR